MKRPGARGSSSPSTSAAAGGRVEPGGPLLRLEHERLAVVDAVEPRLGRPGDHREGGQPRQRVVGVGDRGVAPELVEARHRHAARRRPRQVKNGCLRGLPLRVDGPSARPATRTTRGPARGSAVAARARAKAGLSATDSTRALIIRAPPRGSFDQLGTRPQVSSRSWRRGRRLTVLSGGPGEHDGGPLGRGHVVVGATGRRFLRVRPARCARARRVRSSSTSNSSTSSSGFAVAAYRPHMHSGYAPGVPSNYRRHFTS